MSTHANGCVLLYWDECEDAYYLHNLGISLWLHALGALTCTPHNIVPLCSDNVKESQDADRVSQENKLIIRTGCWREIYDFCTKRGTFLVCAQHGKLSIFKNRDDPDNQIARDVFFKKNKKTKKTHHLQWCLFLPAHGLHSSFLPLCPCVSFLWGWCSVIMNNCFFLDSPNVGRQIQPVSFTREMKSAAASQIADFCNKCSVYICPLQKPVRECRYILKEWHVGTVAEVVY